jgi:hypothetical protein
MFTLVMGVMVLVLSFGRSAAKASHLQIGAFCLAISGAMYTLGYLFVGVASQSRYHYWSMIAIFIAAVMCISDQRRRLVWRSRTGWVCMAILVITQTAILVAHAMCGDALSQAS